MTNQQIFVEIVQVWKALSNFPSQLALDGRLTTMSYAVFTMHALAPALAPVPRVFARTRVFWNMCSQSHARACNRVPLAQAGPFKFFEMVAPQLAPSENLQGAKASEKTIPGSNLHAERDGVAIN